MTSPIENPENNYFQILGDKFNQVAEIFDLLQEGENYEGNDKANLIKYISQNFDLLIQDKTYNRYPYILLKPSILLRTYSEIVNPPRNEFHELLEEEMGLSKYKRELDPAGEVGRNTENLLGRVDELLSLQDQNPPRKLLIQASSFLGFVLALYIIAMKDSGIEPDIISESIEEIKLNIDQFFNSSIEALEKDEETSLVGKLPGVNPKAQLYRDFKSGVLDMFNKTLSQDSSIS